MEKPQMKKIYLLLALFTAFYSSFAMAEIQLTARAAADLPTSNFGFVSSPSPMLAGDLTYGLSDLFQLGVTYDHNFLSYNNNGGSGTENFYGGIVRFGFISGLFVDGQGGICTRDGSSNSFSWGAGLGYAYPFSPFVFISPRVGYRSLPDNSVTRSMVDLGLQVTFRLF
jgi:hypothetical protein